MSGKPNTSSPAFLTIFSMQVLHEKAFLDLLSRFLAEAIRRTGREGINERYTILRLNETRYEAD